jgi:hypothetical protein
MKEGPKEKADGILAAARETADALGRLTMQHLRLARLEMQADLRAMGLQTAWIAGLAALAIVGYALTMAGLALVIGGGWREGLPFLLIGGAHVVVAGLGIMIAIARLRRMRPMNATAGEVSRSLAPLGLSPGGPADVPFPASGSQGSEDSR